jgi:hypothetical protein
MMVFRDLEINTLKFWQQRKIEEVVLIAKTVTNYAK